MAFNGRKRARTLFPPRAVGEPGEDLAPPEPPLPADDGAARLLPWFARCWARTCLTPHALQSVLGPEDKSREGLYSGKSLTAVKVRVVTVRSRQALQRTTTHGLISPAGPSLHCGVAVAPHSTHTLPVTFRLAGLPEGDGRPPRPPPPSPSSSSSSSSDRARLRPCGTGGGGIECSCIPEGEAGKVGSTVAARSMSRAAAIWADVQVVAPGSAATAPPPLKATTGVMAPRVATTGSGCWALDAADRKVVGLVSALPIRE